MESFSAYYVLPYMCQAKAKFGMRFSISNGSTFEEVRKAAPWMTLDQYMENEGWLIFDSEAEMLATYRQTVGDDGPTKSNPYKGPAKVYACTCGPDGSQLAENT